MTTETQTEAGWGYANGGRTEKAHLFTADRSKSLCGRYEKQTTIIFTADDGKHHAYVNCQQCEAKR